MIKSVLVVAKHIEVVNGASIRVEGLVEGLASHGYAVKLLTIPRTGNYFFNAFSNVQNFPSEYDLLKYDCVYIVGLELAPLVSKRSRGIWILDVCDSVVLSWWRASKPNPIKLTLGALSRLKLSKFIHRFDLLSYVLEAEMKVDRLLFHNSRFVVVPNAVNIKFDVGPVAVRQLHKFGFVADLSYEPNKRALDWFINEVWSTETVGNWQMMIFGPSRPSASLPQGITYVGVVNPLSKVYESVDFTIVPDVIGTGYKNKLGESLMARKPVVSTKLGAKGYLAHDGLFVAKNSIEFRSFLKFLCTEENAIKVQRAMRRPSLPENWNVCLDSVAEKLDKTS